MITGYELIYQREESGNGTRRVAYTWDEVVERIRFAPHAEGDEIIIRPIVTDDENEDDE